MEMVILLLICVYIFWKIRQQRIRDQSDNSIRELMAHSMSLMQEKRSKIEAQGIPYIRHNPTEGIFQMVDFPYQRFEEWYAVYGRAANGRTAWKLKDSNKTYEDWQNEMLSSAEGQEAA